MNLIIAGGRDFSNYDLLKLETMKFITEYKPTHQITVISGKANGTDQLGERFANEFNLNLLEFPADWNKWGKQAGPKRNREMAKHATHLIAFWDGTSKGTKNMIETAIEFELKVKTVNY
jgi:hypothetical protein